jgi:hypothetical protein
MTVQPIRRRALPIVDRSMTEAFLPLDAGTQDQAKAIVRRLQAALVPSVLPVGPPEDAVVQTLKSLIADRRVQAVLPGRPGDPVAVVIRKVQDILARQDSNEEVIDELWEVLDDPRLERHLANASKSEAPEALIRRMYQGPYGKYVADRWSRRDRRLRRRFRAGTEAAHSIDLLRRRAPPPRPGLR